MLTRKTSYALRAMCKVAAEPQATHLSAEIARSEAIPKRFLDSILRQLTQHGLLSARRGRLGGYSLGMPAERITLRMVMQAVDGGLFSYPCLNGARPSRCPECPGSGGCAASHGLRLMSQAANAALDRTTIATLCAEAAGEMLACSALG
jgi:Rrf2 family protein